MMNTATQKRFFIIIIVLILLKPSFLWAQSIGGTYSDVVPVGTSINLYIQPPSGCTPENPVWSFNPNPTSISYSQSDQHVMVSWNYATYVTISASIACKENPSANKIPVGPKYITIGNLQPKVKLSISSTNMCVGAKLLMSASQPENMGDNGYFTYMVDGQKVYQGVDNTYEYYTGNLSPGTHQASLRIYSSDTGTSYETPTQSFYVKEKATFKIDQFYIQGVICDTKQEAPVSVFISAPSDVGTLRYEFFRNDGSSTVVTTTDHQAWHTYNPINNGDKIHCVVTAAGPNDQGCVMGPLTSETRTVNVTTTTDPTVTIVPDKTTVCSGQSITFTSSQVGEEYTWRLGSRTICSGKVCKSTILTTSSSDENPEYFSPTDALYLTVTGVSGGSCLASTTAYTSIMGSSISITPLPKAEIIPSGALTICSTCSQLIQPQGTDNTYTYTWSTNGTPNGSTTQTYTASQSGEYRVTTTAQQCSKTSAPLILSINKVPTANAGPDQHLALPIQTLVLTGTGTDIDGSIVSYLWSKLSGPSVTMSQTQTANLSLTNLTAGVYVFRVTVKDNINEFAYDDVKIIIDPPNNYNFVREQSISIAGVGSYEEATTLSIGDRQETTNYFDGLGRAIQKVDLQVSPTNHDMVTPVVYDGFNRESVAYLPYVSGNNGWFKKDFITKESSAYSSATSPQFQFYQNTNKVATDESPYAQKVFEQSPLNRVLKQGNPGSTWQPNSEANFNDYSIKNEYDINQEGEVFLFIYSNATGLVSLHADVSKRHYRANTLLADRTFDEKNNEIIEYRDKQGRVVCKKTQHDTINNVKQYATTYYIYDDFGNLVVVLPPEAVKAFSN